MRLIALILLPLLVIRAADVCIREGAVGTQTGVDWDNALTNTPASFTRGNRYLYADGTYSRINFATAVSGTDLVTFLKATESDHGPSTGWSSTYGDGVATITHTASDTLLISSSYLLIDGASGTSNNARGLKFTTTGNGDGEVIGISPGGTRANLTFKNIEVAGSGVVTTNSTNFFYGYSGTVTATSSNILFTNVYFHDNYIWIATSFATDTVIQNSFFERAGSDWPDGATNYWNTPVNYHGVGFTHRTNNFTLKNSIIRDMIGGHNTTYVEPQYLWTNCFIFGNLFYASSTNEATAQACISLAGSDVITNMLVYNNTFHGLAKPGVRINIAGSENVVVANNIWQACRNAVDLNQVTSAFSNTTNGVSFVNTNTYDFHLTSSLAGTNVGSAYSPDMDGIARGTDGVWDQGTYEYVNQTYSPVVTRGRVHTRGKVKLHR